MQLRTPLLTSSDKSVNTTVRSDIRTESYLVWEVRSHVVVIRERYPVKVFFFMALLLHLLIVRRILGRCFDLRLTRK